MKDAATMNAPLPKFAIGDWVKILPFDANERVVEIDEMERFIDKVGKIKDIDCDVDEETGESFIVYEVLIGYGITINMGYYFCEDVLELEKKD